MQTLENRIAALEKSNGTTDSEDSQLNEGFARIQSAGIDVPEPIRCESTAAWLRRFSDAQLTEVKDWLEAEVRLDKASEAINRCKSANNH